MLTFEPEGHVYKWDGVEKESVTQVLSRVGAEVGGSWRSLSGAEFMNSPDAMHFGHVFHDFARRDLLGHRFKYDPALQPWVNGYRQFLAEHTPEPVLFEGRTMTEVPQYCRRYGYAYTPDYPCFLRGGPTVLDWKTGESWCDHWWTQAAAYSIGLDELTNLHRWQTMIVRIGPDSFEARVHTPDQVRRDVNRWMAVLSVYRMVVPQILTGGAA